MNELDRRRSYRRKLSSPRARLIDLPFVEHHRCAPIAAIDAAIGELNRSDGAPLTAIRSALNRPSRLPTLMRSRSTRKSATRWAKSSQSRPPGTAARRGATGQQESQEKH